MLITIEIRKLNKLIKLKNLFLEFQILIQNLKVKLDPIQLIEIFQIKKYLVKNGIKD
jgi:hypothetical protein